MGRLLDGLNSPTRYLNAYSGQTEPPIPVETEPLCYVI